jgi:CRP-like cAMP-binding protein
MEVMDHSLATVTPSSVGVIPHDALRKLTHAHPSVADAFWGAIRWDGAVFREWIVSLGSRDAYGCLAISEIFLKLKAVGLTNGQSFDFAFTQTKIADATGLSNVHVSRNLMQESTALSLSLSLTP